MNNIDDNYLQLYADIVGVDVKDLFSTIPDIPVDDVRNELRNPKGDIKTGIDTCLDIIRKDNPRWARSVSAIVLRYGLDGKGKRTYKQVGLEIDNPVTIERARQIIAKMLRILHQPSRLNIIMGNGSNKSNEEKKNLVNTINETTMNIIDINQITDNEQLCDALKKFTTDVLMKTTISEIFDASGSVSVRTQNCLRRSGLMGSTIDEILLHGGYDFKKIRNCGVKSEEEIKHEIAKWASCYIGAITYDRLIDLFMDDSKMYVSIVNQQRIKELQQKTKERANILAIDAKGCSLEKFMGYICGACCNHPTIPHMQAVYFLNTLHCHNVYDLFKIVGGLPETSMIRHEDDVVIDKIINDWCDTKKAGREILVNSFHDDDISEDMKTLRQIEGKLISQYFSGPNSTEMMDKYSKCKMGSLNIWEISDFEIYQHINKWLDALLPDVMNECWGIKGNALFVGGNESTQLAWANRELETDADRELVSKIQQLFADRGFTISLEQATFLWVTYSLRAECKDWASPTTDDEIWMNIVGYVFTDTIMLNRCIRIRDFHTRYRWMKL